MTVTTSIREPNEKVSAETMGCAGCGETGKALTAPKSNVGKGYEGAMYCLHCNPRFRFVDAHYSCLERMGG